MAQQTTTPGAALRSLRELAGLTLKEVAFKAGTALSYLSKVERGELQPSQAYVARVAHCISTSMLKNSNRDVA